MSALSVVRSERKVVTLVVNPLFLLSALRVVSGAEVVFEVFEADASKLCELVGNVELYYLDDKLFWARLKSLKTCESVHPALSLLRHKPTLRGVFSVLGESPEQQ